MNLNKAFEFDNGFINDGAVVPESLQGAIRSSKPIYSGDLISQIIYYKSLSQTTINRIMSTSFTYDGSDKVTTITTSFYDTDGTTVYQTYTTTVTYNGDNVSNLEGSAS